LLDKKGSPSTKRRGKGRGERRKEKLKIVIWDKTGCS
jgi:hypothetical protein